MKVLYDYQAFDMQSHGGVSRCIAELYSHLPHLLNAEISVLETDNVYLQGLGFKKKGYTYRNFLWSKDTELKKLLYKISYNLRYGHYSKWDRTPDLNLYESIRRQRMQDYDIFHPTFFFSYFLKHIGNKPFVVTVHDMIPELYPNYFSEDDDQIVQKKIVIPKAAHIIAVSEQTKKDLLRLMNIPEEKVTVIYHGADESPYIPSVPEKLDYEYILYVGERGLYKNFKPFCRSCIPVLKRHVNLKVVCTGKPFTDEEVAFFDSCGLADRFVHKFVLTTQEMMDLYHYAVAFVYPSEYEGFGLPILESYKADCPVMLNRASCFPEIASDAAIYFNLNKGVSDFEEQFETLYYMSDDERNALIDRQRERLRLFSWEKSAQNLADVYDRVLCGK
ncbi:MAG: glycosyltransferase family 1 protein [Prevotella sp.]|nr:glycosyltransferase family 1 protein [Prevotella sp.]